MSHAPAAATATPRPLAATRRVARALAVPVALYGLALATSLLATALVAFPANEGSAYYAAVAGNLVEGRGLVIDAVWSYATPPLVLPRPAFELWQPLASFVAALPMTVAGTSFDAAQVGGAMTAALLAPLTWLVARQAAAAAGLRGAGETQALAVGAGLLAIASGPVLVATALPDSTIPFGVTAVAAALAISAALATTDTAATRWAFVAGVALGLCWLARHEAVWLGLLVLPLAAAARRLSPRFVVAVGAGGMAVAAGWLVRSWLTFGTPLPGQTVENALLTANEQIYAYAGRPTLSAFLDQGIARIAGNVADGLAHNVLSVLLVPAAPIVIAGVLGAAWLLPRPDLRLTAVGALVLSGGLTLLVTSVVFPVASLWGTFQHAALPLVVGLGVAAVLGLDAAVRSVGRHRKWQRRNAWLAPLALVVLTLPLSALQLVGLAAEADRLHGRTSALAAVVTRQPELAADPGAVVISDHPVWLSEATGAAGIALPAESLDSVLALASRFDARLVALYGERGDYPQLLRSPAAEGCFSERRDPALPAGTALFAIAEACLP